MSELQLEVDVAVDAGQYFIDAGQYFIVVPKGEPWLTEEEAKEIIHRCNCHDELVAACEQVIKNWDGNPSGNDRKAFPALALEYDLCKAALANAEKS